MKLYLIGLMAFTLSVYGQDAKVASSSDSAPTNRQPVEKANAGPYDDDNSDDENQLIKLTNSISKTMEINKNMDININMNMEASLVLHEYTNVISKLVDDKFEAMISNIGRNDPIGDGDTQV